MGHQQGRAKVRPDLEGEALQEEPHRCTHKRAPQEAVCTRTTRTC